MPDKILVVDDKIEIADLIDLYLKNENYTVYKFYTAQEALSCIQSTELDLAILDIMLPGTNGFAICQKIRKQHNYPVIMLTAKRLDEARTSGTGRAGAGHREGACLPARRQDNGGEPE